MLSVSVIYLLIWDYLPLWGDCDLKTIILALDDRRLILI